MPLALFAAIVLTVRGCVYVFSPDTAWSWQKWRNASMGVSSERTDAWETNNKIASIVSLILGIGFFGVALFLSQVQTGPPPYVVSSYDPATGRVGPPQPISGAQSPEQALYKAVQQSNK